MKEADKIRILSFVVGGLFFCLFIVALCMCICVCLFVFCLFVCLLFVLVVVAFGGYRGDCWTFLHVGQKHV